MLKMTSALTFATEQAIIAQVLNNVLYNTNMYITALKRS